MDKAKLFGNSAIPLMKAEKKAKESGNDWKAYQAFGAYIFCLSVYGFKIFDEEPNDGFIIVFPAISNIT